MLYAVFAGKGVDGAFQKTVCRILREKTDFIQISRGRLTGSGGDITVVFEPRPSEILLKNAVVFLSRCRPFKMQGEKICVCNSAHPSDMIQAGKSGGDVITCGLSHRDSVTFSSILGERCMISVQRRITELDGKKTEPLDFPANALKDDDLYAVLCANLLLLLCGFRPDSIA